MPSGNRRNSMLLRLPMAVLGHILQIVEGPLPSFSNENGHPSNVLLQLRPVCKFLQDAVDATVSRVKCCLQYPARENGELIEHSEKLPADYRELLHKGLTRWPSLRTLAVHNHFTQSSDFQLALDIIRSSCPHLEELRIINKGSTKGASLTESLHLLPQLRTLELHGMALESRDEVSLLPQLNEMRLEDCKLGSRLQTTSTLHSLSTRRLKWETDELACVEPSPGLASLTLEAMEIGALSLPTTLTLLSLKGISTFITGSATVSLPSLTKLALVDLIFKGPPPTFELPVSLTSLELKGRIEHEDPFVDVLGIDHFEATPPLLEPLDHSLSQLTNLQSLSVSCYNAIHSLRTVSSLSQLEVLHLDKLSRLTEFPVIGRLESLCHLHISSCPVRYVPDLSSLLRLQSIYLNNLFELIEYPELAGWVLSAAPAHQLMLAN